MTFRTRILLALLAVGVVPALAVSALSWSANRDELISTVGGAQQQVATEAALSTEQSVQQSVEDLRRAVDYLPFTQLSEDELTRVLAIPFRQMPSLEALAVLDAKGNAVVPPLVRSDDRRAALPQFAERIPLRAALSDGLAIGAPWSDGDGGALHLAIAVRVGADDAAEGAEDPAAGTSARVLAGEVSLRTVKEKLDALAHDGRFAALVAADGQLIAHAAPKDLTGLDALPELRALAALPADAPANARVTRARTGGAEWLLASAPLGRLKWTLVVAQPGAVAFRAADRVARYVGYWAAIALLLTFVLGLFIARGFGQPVAALSRAADALRGGDYAKRAQIASGDELGKLAATFNAMAEEISRRDREIRTFNEVLQQRVDEKTAQLREARDQIERSRRLEGLVTMGAGVAHEMNNPLTSVLGILTLLKEETPASSPNAELLDVAEKDAGRIADIVERFRRMVERDVVEAVRFDVTEAVRDAISTCSTELDAHRVTLRTALPPAPLHVNGDPRQFSEAVVQLLRNAAQAMPEGGALEIQVGEPEKGAVKLTVSDTGHGIPAELRERVFDPFFTTRRQAGRLGLGLTVAHRVVQAHHGRILLDSTTGRGTTVTVLLPAAAGAAHLR